MKKKFTLQIFYWLIILLFFHIRAAAQCSAGYTAAKLNWDNLDFLPSNNVRYTGFYPSAAFPYNQNFTIGTRRVNFVMAPQANITLNGENGTNTGHTGSFAAAGDDVQFTTTSAANTTVTMTFDADVANVMFSLFDLDINQRVTITALNTASVAQTITIVNANGTSGITIAGSGTVSAVATGPVTGYASTDNRGTINVTVAGPVNRVILTCSNATGDVWLSDIDACVTGSFPNNYQQISRPFTGQPQYVLAVVNNNTYYVDPTNGKAYFLFNEPGHDRLNSMAYDPYRREVYYTYSLTGRVGLNPQNDKTLKKYSVDTKTISVVIPDVNTFGIPTYESGVESGAASFYNGSLYLGIEGYTGTTGSGAYAASRKSSIWKIDFDLAGNPVPPAAQVWGVTADDGVNAQNIHDWSDFAVSNGVLTDFDGSQSGDVDFYQTNLFTGVTTNYIPAGALVPRQVSIGWNESLYNVDATLALYNGTNNVGTAYTISSPLGPTIPTGAAASWGDAAGPYRPFLDFGDAPATYDPIPLSPACHDTLTPTVSNTRTRMILGPAEDVEWLKKGLTSVEDTFEDGLAFVPIFSPITGSYIAQVSVLNNTGSNATLCAWLDFNANGYFDVAESIVPITVPSAAGTQSFWLNWPSTPSPLTTGFFTYLRIRITSATYGMAAANSTGYYDMGEVEDYRIVVDNSVLSIPLINFNAGVENNDKVNLAWSVTEDPGYMAYTAERSENGTDWEDVSFVPASGASGTFAYIVKDNNPFTGVSYYRLRLNDLSGPVRYSAIRSVKIDDMNETVSLYPNPASGKVTMRIGHVTEGQTAHIHLINSANNSVLSKKVVLTAGTNSVEIPLDESLPAGIYFVKMSVNDKIVSKKLVVKK
ncbi:MAG: T9SS type A sorting domain-containing protein [Chitinophagaceae bacterium]|nr:T9SS type A sorting domain-containing protein [Chitinophagaceae bacterium]